MVKNTIMNNPEILEGNGHHGRISATSVVSM